jgi:hypothetical protein
VTYRARIDAQGVWLNVGGERGFDLAWWTPAWLRSRIGPEPRRHLYHLRKRNTPVGVLRLTVAGRRLVGRELSGP